LVECATTSARLGFYPWEDNLVGPARELGPGADARDPEAVMAQVRSNWIAAGRQPAEGQNRAFIAQGAEPTIWNAVQLASQQKRVDDCTRCLSSDKFYLFEEKAPHKLISGPVANRSDLYFDSKGQPLPERGIVETVPQGTIVVEEPPRDPRTGSRITEPGQSGFFVLEDDPELTGADIETPQFAANPISGGPVVTFGFTDEGIEAFGKMTGRLAKQGLVNASGLSGFPELEFVPESFAIILDDQVLDLPEVNFLEYPDGIDGSTGFQIYGGFDSETTRALVRYLRRGAMPVELTLTGQRRGQAGGAESGSD
jgi:hypothetical protein